MCGQCDRKFDTWQGLRVHQGTVCMRKRRQCRSTDRKTRSKSSQDDNHSGAISASVDSPSTPSQSKAGQQTQEPGVRKPKILWLAANEKEKYKTLEEKVQKKEAKKNSSRPDAKETLSVFANGIYVSASEEFGTCEENMKTPVKKGGLSRRQRVLAQLRKQKRDLQKPRKSTSPEEKEEEGLRTLFESHLI